MFPGKNDSLSINNNNIQQINNDENNINKISTNRLLNESISLNTKVEKYRQALSMNSASLNNINSLNILNDNNNNYNNNINNSNSMIGSKSKNQNNNNSLFHPQYNINTLGSLSKEFTLISKKPEELKELFNQQNKKNN